MDTLINQIIQIEKEVDELREKMDNENNVEKFNQLSELWSEKNTIKMKLRVERLRQENPTSPLLKLFDY